MSHTQNVVYGVVTEIKENQAFISAHNTQYQVVLNEETKNALSIALKEQEDVIVSLDVSRQELVDIDMPELSNAQLVGL